LIYTDRLELSSCFEGLLFAKPPELHQPIHGHNKLLLADRSFEVKTATPVPTIIGVPTYQLVYMLENKHFLYENDARFLAYPEIVRVIWPCSLPSFFLVVFSECCLMRMFSCAA
jgi:hypothetical protein